MKVILMSIIALLMFGVCTANNVRLDPNTVLHCSDGQERFKDIQNPGYNELGQIVGKVGKQTIYCSYPKLAGNSH